MGNRDRFAHLPPAPDHRHASDAWKYDPIDLARHEVQLRGIIAAVRAEPNLDQRALRHILRQFPRDGQGFFSKSELVRGYQALCDAGTLTFDRDTLRRLQMKPVRTQSGVAPVAVLTKPAGCPGKCIFCPNDPEMPKSYLSWEPGAQRALRHDFDPFEQTASRITALRNTGHPAQKIELIILGATWSAYPRSYQEWFVQRCLDAMNGSNSASLAEAQTVNERAAVRCVGMTVETRPDWVTLDEAIHLRKLGVTRVQIGIQSLDDHILEINRRGHDMAAARRASRLLRAAGFKLLMHWMPNLLGATPKSDRQDYLRLWTDPDMRPDELKLYPCSLIAGTELYTVWQQGGYQPYDHETLVDLVADCKAATPRYCRLDRVIRDIPATYVVVGNQFANLREMAKQKLRESGRVCQCIRCREVRGEEVTLRSLKLEALRYPAGGGQEVFLSMETRQHRLAGFVRLHLPSRPETVESPPELRGCAVIRQLHVYGPSLPIGGASDGEAQHRGIGQRLLNDAADESRRAGFKRLAVIASIGTREYYRQHGFETGEFYMARDL